MAASPSSETAPSDVGDRHIAVSLVDALANVRQGGPRERRRAGRDRRRRPVAGRVRDEPESRRVVGSKPTPVDEHAPGRPAGGPGESTAEQAGADAGAGADMLSDEVGISDDDPWAQPEDREDVSELGDATTGDGTGSGTTSIEQIAALDGAVTVGGSDAVAEFELTGRPRPR